MSTTTVVIIVAVIAVVALLAVRGSGPRVTQVTRTRHREESDGDA